MKPSEPPEAGGDHEEEWNELVRARFAPAAGHFAELARELAPQISARGAALGAAPRR